MVVPLVVLGAAWGLRRFLGAWPSAVVLAAFLGTSALGIIDVTTYQRTQLDELATVIERDGAPGRRRRLLPRPVRVRPAAGRSTATSPS